MSKTYAKVGAAIYVLWGIVHLGAAYSVYMLAKPLDAGMEQGRLYQAAWNLLFFSITAVGVGCALNWRNRKTGFWVNLAAISVADVGFILFVLVPGYMPLWPGLLGPALWVIGTAFLGAAYPFAERAETLRARTLA